MRTRLMLGSALVACFALSGCGAEETPSPSANSTKATPKATKKATPVAAPTGTWAFHFHGATGYVIVPVPRTDPRLAEIEGYRKRARSRPACYAIVKVDNTRGTTELFINSLQTGAHRADAEYDSADYWVALWAKNRGRGNKQPDGDDPQVKLRHPYNNMQFAPGKPRPGYKGYGLPEKGTIVFAVEDVGTKAGIRPCGNHQGEPSEVILVDDGDKGGPIWATKVPTSATQ